MQYLNENSMRNPWELNGKTQIRYDLIHSEECLTYTSDLCAFIKAITYPFRPACERTDTNKC